MSKKEFFKSLKSKLVIILALIALVCLSCFTFIACDDQEKTTSSSVKDPTYTYTPNEEGKTITNSNFTTGAIALENDKYPVTSPTGWSRTLDGSAKTSIVKSGAVSTRPSSWKALIEKFVKDTNFSYYLKEQIKIKNASGEISADVLKPDDKLEDKVDEIIQYFYPNPGSSDSDNTVYMLNNYLKEDASFIGVGTAQKVTSSKKITLERGKYGVFTVNVKTANISGINADNFGANIRVTNSFNSVSQADVSITNIIADEWTEYKLYVKADAMYDSTFTLVLGLGFGGTSASDTTYYTEGTVYFDNVNFEEITALPEGVIFDSQTKATMTYGEKTAIKLSSGSSTNFFYDMSFDTTNLFSLTPTINADYTKSTVNGANGQPITSQTLYPESSTVTKNIVGNSIELSNAKDIAYSIKLLAFDGNNFKLQGDKNSDISEYAIIKFAVDNKLSDLATSQLVINVADIKDGKTSMRKAVALLSKVDGKTEYTILVENQLQDGEREFYIEILVGADNLSKDVFKSQLANGDLTISDIEYKIASIPKVSSDDLVYNFYGRNPSASLSLYSGYAEEPVEDDESIYHNIQSAPGSVGIILTKPAEIENYTPSRELDSTKDYAGVINTKYLEKYNEDNRLVGASLKTALGYNDGDDEIQPMVIYNKTKASLGYIGTTNTIAANAKGKVSVSLRVYGENAQAYVYLVDSTTKSILTFSDFTDVNGNYVAGSSFKYMFKVTEDMLDEDGWLTVSFFIGTGTASKSFRVEVWNGDKTLENNPEAGSEGFVFVKDITVSPADGFSTPDRVENAFTVSGNPLFEQGATAFFEGKIFQHIRELSDEEIAYNKKNPDKATDPLPAYVWAQNDTVIYSVYETLNPEAFTADTSTDTDADAESGCTATTDPSTFWMSFSSILLGVVLVLAIIALIVKRVVIKRKANASDAKTHYTVRSRTSYKAKEQDNKQLPEETEEPIEDEYVEPEQVEETSNEDTIEQTLDDYVYGDVQDFGETETNEQVEEQLENSEEKTEE